MDEMIKGETEKKISRSPVVIALTVIALAFAFIVVYKHVTNIIVDTNIDNMEELAEHDKQSIENTLTGQWKEVEGAARELRKSRNENVTELLDELSAKKVFFDCNDLILVDTEGNMYHANGVIDTNEDYMELIEAHEGNFIYRYDNSGLTVEKRKELLLVGVEIDAFSVDDIRFCYILEELDVNTLQEQLKIETYDGKGYSSVISSNGTYIVSVSQRHSLQSDDNFFEDFASGRFDRQHTIDSLMEEIKKLDKGETISATCENGDETYIMIFTPVESADWYYVMAVPKSVFEAQSVKIVRIYGILAAVIMLAACGGVLFFVRTQQQKAKADAKYHEELAEAYQLAQQANRAKTTFLNNMSHDIRTPMNAIIGYTALAATHIDNLGMVKDYLAKITQSSNHLLSLINDVLDMSRIESGKVTINETEESLSEILHNLKDIIQADVKAKQLDFFIDAVDITDEDIWCDRLRLNQVLLNILSNAVKYTAPGGIVSMCIAEKEIHNGYAVYEFRVKDNGIGMSEEFAATVFDPFTREQTATVSGIQGTGLGMAITKNIVELMGGTIVCNSKEHVGTEFIVTIGFKLRSEHKGIEVITNLEGLRGLVVDDDMTSCQSVSAMLRQVGMRSEWCMYGKEAVARTEEAIRIGDKFQVYIIDWLMPDMNGVETARRIRKAVGEDAPIIILTAYDWSDIEEEAREAGVTDFVSKPIFPSGLHRALMKVCGESVEDEIKNVSYEFAFEGKKILLVEDNEINQEIALELLTEEGLVVETADNGKIACDTLLEKGAGYYDLVLMDVQMPIMDGYEAARTIRKFEDKELAGIPIIAMTANAFAEDKQSAREAGMDGHIAKPIDIPKLFETLQEILNKELP